MIGVSPLILQAVLIQASASHVAVHAQVPIYEFKRIELLVIVLAFSIEVSLSLSRNQHYFHVKSSSDQQLLCIFYTYSKGGFHKLPYIWSCISIQSVWFSSCCDFCLPIILYISFRFLLYSRDWYHIHYHHRMANNVMWHRMSCKYLRPCFSKKVSYILPCHTKSTWNIFHNLWKCNNPADIQIVVSILRMLKNCLQFLITFIGFFCMADNMGKGSTSV